MKDPQTGETQGRTGAGTLEKAHGVVDAMGEGCLKGCGCALLLMIASVVVLTAAGVETDPQQHGGAFGALGLLLAVIGAVVGLAKALRRRSGAQPEAVSPFSTGPNIAQADEARRPACADSQVGLSKRATKSKTVAYLLWALFGWAGVHRFYCGKWFTGSVWLLTCGLFGAGWFMDAITTSTLVDESSGLPRGEVSTWVQKELRALRNVGLTILGILGFFGFVTVSVWVAQKLDTTTPEQKAQDAVKANRSAMEAERVAAGSPAEFTKHVDKAYGFSILYPSNWKTFTAGDIREVMDVVNQPANKAWVFAVGLPDRTVNMQVVMEKLDEPMTPGQYFDHAWALAQESPFKARSVGKEGVTIGDAKGFKHTILAATLDRRPHKSIALHLVRGQIGWNVIIGGRPDAIDNMTTVVDRVLASITFPDGDDSSSHE